MSRISICAAGVPYLGRQAGRQGLPAHESVGQRRIEGDEDRGLSRSRMSTGR